MEIRKIDFAPFEINMRQKSQIFALKNLGAQICTFRFSITKVISKWPQPLGAYLAINYLLIYHMLTFSGGFEVGELSVGTLNTLDIGDCSNPKILLTDSCSGTPQV